MVDIVQITNTEIEGVLLYPLKQFSDDRGKVLHMMSIHSPFFEKFGEVYFSKINSGAIKAWKRHKRMVQNIAIPSGAVSIVIYDDREGSSTRGALETHLMSEENYFLLRIPPHLWYGFKGVSSQTSLIVNCASEPHDPNEQERIDYNDQQIPYRW